MGARQDRIVITDGAEWRLDVAVTDLLPALTSVAGWRAEMFSDRFAAWAMKQLEVQGRNSLRESGYV